MKACPVCYEAYDTNGYCPVCLGQGERHILLSAKDLETMAAWLEADGLPRAHDLACVARKLREEERKIA